MSQLSRRWRCLVFLLILGLGWFLQAASHAGDFREPLVQGTSLLNQGKPAAALTHLDQAIVIEPNNVTALNNRAIAYYELGMSQQAKDDLLHALSLNPGNATSNCNLGIILFEEGDYDGAVQYLEEAFHASKGLGPKRQIVLKDLAFIYERQGMPHKAEELRRLGQSSFMGDGKGPSGPGRCYGPSRQDHVLYLRIVGARLSKEHKSPRVSPAP